jgi:hypothetical protein
VVSDTEIKALLEELKAGIEATVAGVFDGTHAWLHASSESSPGTFWAAFNDATCLRADWHEWDMELLADGSARVECQCGAHTLQAFMLHKRWVLIVLAGGPLVPGARTIIDHALEVLKQLLPVLPARRSPAPPIGGAPPRGGGHGPAELGIPVGWIRKRTSS